LWSVIAPVLPDGAGRRGRPWNDHRLTLEGIACRRLLVCFAARACGKVTDPAG